MREGALRKNATRAVMYIFLIAVSLISVFPLYWSFISAFNNTQQILGGWLLPSTHLLENLQHLFEQHNVVRALKNSFATTLLQTFAALAVSSIAGYGFEIYHDKAKDTVMAILMLAMMVPFVAVLVPLFQMFTKAKLINSWTGFILPSIATPFLIMYFRNSARSFPRDTLEAARIDGLNEFQIFIRMFIPMMKPTYASAATITFMGAWNAYLWPKVVMQTNEAITTPMLVANTMGGYVIDYGVVMAAVTICSLPTVIIFFCLRRRVQGTCYVRVVCGVDCHTHGEQIVGAEVYRDKYAVSPTSYKQANEARQCGNPYKHEHPKSPNDSRGIVFRVVFACELDRAFVAFEENRGV